MQFGGLGQLCDGVLGGDDFIQTKELRVWPGYDYLGWSREALGQGSVDIEFHFEKPRVFHNMQVGSCVDCGRGLCRTLLSRWISDSLELPVNQRCHRGWKLNNSRCVCLQGGHPSEICELWGAAAHSIHTPEIKQNPKTFLCVFRFSSPTSDLMAAYCLSHVILCKLKSGCQARLCYPTGMSLFVLVALWFRRIVYLYRCSLNSRWGPCMSHPSLSDFPCMYLNAQLSRGGKSAKN